MSQSIFLSYAQNPPNKQEIHPCSIKHFESNRLCGDSITVYLEISNNTLVQFWFTGETALVTTAAAAMVGEVACWMSLDEILTWKFEQVQEILQIEISTKRIPASCLWLLALRNAIHQYRNDGIRDDFSDVLPEGEL
jgi:nitrogen fixation NifU-like protein